MEDRQASQTLPPIRKSLRLMQSYAQLASSSPGDEKPCAASPQLNHSASFPALPQTTTMQPSHSYETSSTFNLPSRYRRSSSRRYTTYSSSELPPSTTQLPNTTGYPTYPATFENLPYSNSSSPPSTSAYGSTPQYPFTDTSFMIPPSSYSIPEAMQPPMSTSGLSNLGLTTGNLCDGSAANLQYFPQFDDTSSALQTQGFASNTMQS